MDFDVQNCVGKLNASTINARRCTEPPPSQGSQKASSVNVNHCRDGCRLGSCRRSLLQHRLLLLIRQLHPPPPLPAGPPHPPATSKGWCPPYAGLGKPSLHMRTSGPCPKRPTRERSYAVAHTFTIAEPATPPAAAAALHLRVQYVLYATCCVFICIRKPETPKTPSQSVHCEWPPPHGACLLHQGTCLLHHVTRACCAMARGPAATLHGLLPARCDSDSQCDSDSVGLSACPIIHARRPRKTDISNAQSCGQLEYRVDRQLSAHLMWRRPDTVGPTPHHWQLGPVVGALLNNLFTSTC
eukprot:363499-Chlamydomonas_euryale.AAC.6